MERKGSLDDLQQQQDALYICIDVAHKEQVTCFWCPLGIEH